MCKINYAECEKTIMPEKPAVLSGGIGKICLYLRGTCQKKAVDTRTVSGVIKFTYLRQLRASQGRQLEQAGSATATGMFEPSPRASAGPAVPTKRVFRCARPGPGQVRDVAPRADRAANCQSSSCRLWIFSPYLLSGRVGFSNSGTARFDSRKTWAAESAQANRRSAPLCATNPIRTALAAHNSTGYRDSRKVRHYCSSAQHRARSGAAGKKTTLNPQPASSNGATLVAAYEDLRRQALDGIRSKQLGMALLMGQGMAAWVKVCSATLPIPSRACSPPAAAVIALSDLHTETVRILASMALGQTSSGRI